MRLYALRNETKEEAGILAYLECYENPQTFYFEISPEVDPWDLPFVLHEHAIRGEYTIEAAWSLRWVCSRIVPHERQNLGEVLRVNRLLSYDEGLLLDLTKGRCAQDDCYLVPADKDRLPIWYAERLRLRVTDVVSLSNYRLLVTYPTGSALVYDARKALENKREFSRVLADESVFMRVGVQPGGHGACWGDQLMVSAQELATKGAPLPLDVNDVTHIARQALCDTIEAAEILGCTRQNIADLVRRGKLVPVKKSMRSMMFLRRDVIARRQ